MGSIVCIINCNRPCRNLAPVTVAESWCGPSLPPGIAGRDSEPPLDVTDPPGCVAIDVSDEFAALFYTLCKLSGTKTKEWEWVEGAQIDKDREKKRKHLNFRSESMFAVQEIFEIFSNSYF